MGDNSAIGLRCGIVLAKTRWSEGEVPDASCDADADPADDAPALGPRTQHTAHNRVHALRAVLASGCIPVVSTDGLRHYYDALTAHFGRWITAGRRRRWVVDPALLHGQVHKRYQGRRLVRIRYQMVCGVCRALRAALCFQGWSGTIQTALVERVNLTARQRVAALTRRTWATAQTVAVLSRQVAGWRGYYHFVRPPSPTCAHGHAGLADRTALASMRGAELSVRPDGLRAERIRGAGAEHARTDLHKGTSGPLDTCSEPA